MGRPMRFPAYACSSCGTPSSRKWNLRRHITLQHGGMGSCVRFSDYLSGRQVEMYPKSFVDSSPKRKTFTQACFETWLQEFIKEDAKQKAYRVNSYTLPSWSQNAENANQQSGMPRFYPLETHPYGSEIIGYYGLLCQSCFETELFAFTNGSEPRVIQHNCKPENLYPALMLSEDQKWNRLRERQMQIPFRIRDCVLRDWTYDQIFLHSYEVPSDARTNKREIAVPNQYHWAARAIGNGCTKLNYDELTDFLIQVNPRSAGVFYTPSGETRRHYLLRLENTPCSFH
jgi:hypothetical protein